MENHSSVTGWQELFFPNQILLIFGRRCNSYFWDIRLKCMYRLPTLYMPFQFLLTKISKRQLRSCLSQELSLINSVIASYNCKQKIASGYKPLPPQLPLLLVFKGIRFLRRFEAREFETYMFQNAPLFRLQPRPTPSPSFISPSKTSYEVEVEVYGMAINYFKCWMANKKNNNLKIYFAQVSWRDNHWLTAILRIN